LFQTGIKDAEVRPGWSSHWELQRNTDPDEFAKPQGVVLFSRPPAMPRQA